MAFQSADQLGPDYLRAAKKGSWVSMRQFESSTLDDLVNWQDTLGRSALMLAAFCGRKDVVLHLLRSGADAKLADSEGDTAREYARRSHRHTIILMLADYNRRSS